MSLSPAWHLALAAALLLSAPVWAGSDQFGALPGEMLASSMRAAVGRKLKVSLRLHPLESLDKLSVRFDAPPCATLSGSYVHRDGVRLQSGRSATFTVDVLVRAAEPCRIGATVLLTDEVQSRTGWVYAVVLNAKPEEPVRHVKGHDAHGRPTVEAVVK